MNFLTVELNNNHIRNNFQCTHESLNNYLKLQATKESKRGLARVYVLVNNENQVIGYYTLSSAELPKDSVPESLLKKLPQSYSGYPAILIGRLAITKVQAGKGFGGELLVDAIMRCIMHAQSIGTSAIIVDPIDENAISFYKKYMFRSLPESNRMILFIDYNLKQHFSVEK